MAGGSYFQFDDDNKIKYMYMYHHNHHKRSGLAECTQPTYIPLKEN